MNNAFHVAVARNVCHVGTKNARPSIAASSEWGLARIEPLRPYFLGSNRRSRSDEKKLSIPSTSRTLVERRGETSTNSLAGLDAPLACAPSRQTPSPTKLWRTGHTGSRADLWKITTPEGHSISDPFRTEELAAAIRRPKPEKSPGLDSIFSKFILHIGSALNVGFAISSLPGCDNSKFQRSGKEH